MRITKTIREYIESQVKEKYQERIDVISKEYDEQRKAIDERGMELVEEANKMLKHFVSENYPNWIEEGVSVSLARFYSAYHEKMQSEIRKQRHLLNKEIEGHIKDIILTLELGGSKKELLDMLEKIK